MCPQGRRKVESIPDKKSKMNALPRKTKEAVYSKLTNQEVYKNLKGENTFSVVKA